MKWIKKVAETPLTTIAKVIDSLASTPNDRRNAPSVRAVREGIAQAASETMYPVGSIYMSVYEVNPHDLFGGTWTQIKDKFLLASGDTYENGVTGGSASQNYTPGGTVGGHKLTMDEMPSHKHGINNFLAYYSGDPSVEDLGYFAANSYKTNKAVYYAENKSTVFAGGGEGTQETSFTRLDNKTHTHSFTGTQTTFDKMPPYLAVNVWVRTA